MSASDALCWDEDDECIAYIADVTDEEEEAVKAKLRSVHGNTRVRTLYPIFNDDAFLLESTVSTALRLDFVSILADRCGLDEAEVQTRLWRRAGNAKVKTTFPEWGSEPAAPTPAAKAKSPTPVSEAPGGRLDFGLVAGMTASQALWRFEGKVPEYIAEVTGKKERTIRAKLRSVHSNKLVRTLYPIFKDDTFLLESTVSTALRLDFVSVLAERSGLNEAKVRTRLERRAGNTKVKTVFPEWD